MNNQQLKSSLGILEKEIVSIYGAGGKSTLLRLLAEELSGDGRKVVVTTTTKIYQHPDLPLVLGLNLQEAANGLKNNLAGSPLVILAGELLQGYKLKGIDPSWPGRLIEEPEVSCILAECDGAAGRPLKGYAPYEPVLPPDSSIAVPVLGLSSLGAILDSERVHRPALFSEMAGIKMGEIIKIEHLIRSMKRMIELGRRQAPRARVVPVFNQVDQVSDKRVIKRIAGFMAGYPEVDRLLFVSARQP
ncbi:MAG TPA: putative selenium-dependent hydroxylase accessory protein YqeC, partial [Firmicutes bacterium]|nr:putative selenium-dependent hydroxylase accessory protein YqeC [Bacillota bacterium]